MRTRLALALALTAGALLLESPVLGAASATVRVDGNAFAPVGVAVDARGTVSWVVQEGGHTIVADDGRFDFRGSNGTPLPAGTTVSFAVGDDEYVAYHCDIHGGPGGQGMAGRIRVGTPPAPPPHRQPVIRVPADAATLAAAVALAAPGHRIELAPGDHAVTEPVKVSAPDITISGSGPTSRLVPAPGPGGFPSTALHISGSRARLERLAVASFRTSGIHLDATDGAGLVDVRVDGADLTQDGIVVTAGKGVTLRATRVTGNRRAGVRIAGCGACGVLIDRLRSHDNAIGVLVESAVGVTVRRSIMQRNDNGIVARTIRGSSPFRPVTVTIVDNLVDQSAHTGVRLAGASDSAVARNEVGGGRRGIVIAGDWSRRTTVDNNVVDGGIAWDGAGHDVAFAANRDRSGEAVEPALDPTASLP